MRPRSRTCSKVAFEGEEFSVERALTRASSTGRTRTWNHTTPTRLWLRTPGARRKDTGRVAVFMVLWKDELARLRASVSRRRSPEKSPVEHRADRDVPQDADHPSAQRSSRSLRTCSVLLRTQRRSSWRSASQFEVRIAPKTLGELAKKGFDSRSALKSPSAKGNADDVIEALGDAGRRTGQNRGGPTIASTFAICRGF